MTMSTIPYRLPKVIAAVADGAVIYIAEGEKDCSSLAKFSVVATCNTDGGGRWPQHLSEHFRGARVRIIPANDKTGRTHCRMVGAALQGIAASIDVLELPDLPEKGDVSDWLAIGGTADKLNMMAGRPWTEWVAEQPAGVETFSATRPDDAADKNSQKTSNFAACGGVTDNKAADGQDAQVRCAQCGEPDTPGDTVRPFGLDPPTPLHLSCWQKRHSLKVNDYADNDGAEGPG